MKLWTTLTDAVTGWIAIAQGDPAWRGRFALSTPGLTTALAIFAFVAFLAIAFASMSIGMPSAAGVLVGMFVLALPVTALVVALVGTRIMLKTGGTMLPMLVPGIFLLTAFLLLEGMLAMIGGPVVMLAWLAMGYLLFQLARLATAWSFGSSVAFAVLTVALLVAMRLALYMLTTPAVSPV